MSKERDLFRAIVLGGLAVVGAGPACSCGATMTATDSAAPDGAVADSAGGDVQAGEDAPRVSNLDTRAPLDTPADATANDVGDDAAMVLIL